MFGDFLEVFHDDRHKFLLMISLSWEAVMMEGEMDNGGLAAWTAAKTSGMGWSDTGRLMFFMFPCHFRRLFRSTVSTVRTPWAAT